jgi:hypothetical protein
MPERNVADRAPAVNVINSKGHKKGGLFQAARGGVWSTTLNRLRAHSIFRIPNVPVGVLANANYILYRKKSKTD